MAAAAAIIGNLPQVEVHVCFDATAAAGIAEGRYWSQTLDSFSLRVTSLMHLAQKRGGQVHWRHVRAHQGDPMNELVDSAAKAAAANRFKSPLAPEHLALVFASPETPYLWWFSQAEGLPSIDAFGAACIGAPPISHNGPLDLSFSSPAPRQHASWHFRLVTYNCLSLCSLAQRECLQTQFLKLSVHVVGIQETRRSCEPLHFLGPFAIFASQPEAGQFGCQLWMLRGSPLATTAAGDMITFEPAQASIFHASPRLLVVLWDTGDVAIAFCVAHAPTAVAAEEEQQAWWTMFQSTLRRLPRKFQPLLLVDANARLAPGSSGCITDGQCLNKPARFLLDLMSTQHLAVSGNVDCHGDAIVSWCSPTGHSTCLDYFLLPSDMAAGMKVHGNIPGFSDCFDFDHRPVLFECRWTSSAKKSPTSVQFDRRAILSPQGRDTMREIFRRAPRAAWEAHADDYLNGLNSFLRQELEQHFPLSVKRPRQSHVSTQTWHHIRLLRRSRRHLHHMKREEYLLQMRRIWHAWKGRPAPVHPRSMRQLCLVIARCARLVRETRRRQRSLLRQDAARHTRECFQEARHIGPDGLASLLRGILKTGRSYKPARMAAAISTEHGLATSPSAVADLFGQHFAQAERACPTNWDHLRRVPAVASSASVDLQQVPAVSELARSFASLKRNKAPGLLGLPAEIYAGGCGVPLAAPVARSRRP